MKTKFLVYHSVWEDNDYVVSVRPEWEKSWRDVPIGRAMSQRDAKLVAEWLQGALPDLWQIFENVTRMEKEEEQCQEH